ncbi:Protein-export protein SecB (maintains pre-export unfolded state) [hydrothermal vent metagenome]|uniref:Protein-export protein SecB (Maintains pre-export unfolded state) n=1 Tax=hydrothermal vent metagenome TaxID=652676 RepID=A0A3B0VK28_9ZZZZ
MSEQKTNQEMPIFRLQKLYIKDLSFENPGAPEIFLTRGQEPKVDFNLQLNNQKIDDDNWEVSIAITAKVMDKNTDDTVMFVVEIEHAGVFLLKNIPAEHIERVLAIDCPLMLFPFTRQVVSQVSVDGGFMPFLMEPINFLALYDNARQQSSEEKQ